MLPALEEHALRGEVEVRKAALLGLEALGRHAVLLEMGHFEGSMSGLLTCCCDDSREVSQALLCEKPCMQGKGMLVLPGRVVGDKVRADATTKVFGLHADNLGFSHPCAVQVCMVAQQALEAIAGKLPRQQAFHKIVDALRAEQKEDMGAAPVMQVQPSLMASTAD
jgi:hypothetical protein